MTDTFVYLIRHGETDAGQKSEYCGLTDCRLNSSGIRQAELLSQRFKKSRFAAVYSSSLSRAYETAVRIAESRSLKVKKLSSFNEIDFGRWEGMKDEEIRKEYRDLYFRWLKDPLTIDIPGGESLIELRNRVTASLRRLVKRHNDQTIAVVTHGGPLRVILVEALNLDLGTFFRIDQAPAAVNIVEYRQGTFLVRLINDTTHLNTNSYGKDNLNHRGSPEWKK